LLKYFRLLRRHKISYRLHHFCMAPRNDIGYFSSCIY
jgi:hypothetical protein